MQILFQHTAFVILLTFIGNFNGLTSIYSRILLDNKWNKRYALMVILPEGD
ncbi:hypothetical protein [Clostridium polynesiense]|uniref:hypothetical protein n=1 Tax=Clostridium polynesiense TaxID=1325933 RepID=UPI000AD00790|nr:hypothetical protein [Clostridium polynesiense]